MKIDELNTTLREALKSFYISTNDKPVILLHEKYKKFFQPKRNYNILFDGVYVKYSKKIDGDFVIVGESYYKNIEGELNDE